MRGEGPRDRLVIRREVAGERLEQVEQTREFQRGGRRIASSAVIDRADATSLARSSIRSSERTLCRR